ncbi:hypothetical protein BKA62DRAFT_699458 [Auriculariales sp. MPI-PUGE-AT-0066]|nr:hypothetical protein BKA62DRAFT_699458 [Auriculariales sp. MPI-PUGE-AT-0066]
MSHSYRAELDDLRSDVNSLLILDEELLRLHDDCENAAAALQHARLAYEGAQAQRRSLHATITTKRQRVIAAGIGVFPIEMLQRVFTFAALNYEYFFPNKFSALSSHLYLLLYSSAKLRQSNRALLPYRLRSVCRRWRDVADKTQALWTFFAVPDALTWAKESKQKMFAHFARIIARSGEHPLDVLLVYDRHEGERITSVCQRQAQAAGQDERKLDQKIYGKIFDHLYACSHRIRNFGVFAPTVLVVNAVSNGQPLLNLVLDLLRLPLPILTSLYLATRGIYLPDGTDGMWTFQNHDNGGTIPLLLPESPQLEQIAVDRVPFQLHPAHPGLTGLRRMWVNYERIDKPDILPQNPAHVQRLPNMPSLTTLELSGKGTRECLNPNHAPLVPNLKKFEGDGDSLPTFKFPVAMAKKLTSLTLVSISDFSQFMKVVRSCKNLQWVTLRQSDIDIKAFFNELAEIDISSQHPKLWPRLTHISLDGIDCSKDDGGILRAAKARAAAALARENHPAWQIRSVALDRRVVPRSVERQLKILLGDTNVYLY